MPEEVDRSFTVAWCRDPAIADAAAALFAAEADPAYISHGELQSGRAVGLATWAQDLDARIRDAVRRAAAHAGEAAGLRFATVTEGGALVGFALVTLVPEAPQPYAVLDDLLIASAHRGFGLGDRVLAWLAEECRARGIARLFLESGRMNHRAHAFFQRHGFQPTSVVMMRDL